MSKKKPESKNILDIGHRIMLARHHRGLTQRELGKRLGVSDTAVYLWEVNKRKIDAVTISEVSYQLDVPITYFFYVTHEL
jgi:transcriptional regulator with XRE-family HTH domain